MMILVLILGFNIGSSDAQRGGFGYNPGNSGGSQIINCQARGSGVHYCRANQLKSVELIRVFNQSGQNNPCLNNWGYSDQGLWVRRGCQAEFRVSYWQDYGGGGRPDSHGSGDVLCESNYGQTSTCQANTSGGVSLLHTTSRQSCRGQWGYNSNSIWVKNGCGAWFRLNNNGGYNPNGGSEVSIHKCKSRNYEIKYCDVGQFDHVEMKREISHGKYPCRGNWGVDRNRRIWVDNNCYGEFRVYR